MFFFFFNATATTEIYTLSLHDALPIYVGQGTQDLGFRSDITVVFTALPAQDRKSTRLNSSHPSISYAVFCLKKKKTVPAEEPLSDEVPDPAELPPHIGARRLSPHLRHV